MASNIVMLFAFLCAAVLPSAYGMGRIVGGQDTTIQRRPYQASLQYIRGTTISHSCGASIISDKFLLSAAHCHPGANLNILYARVGSTAYNSGGQLLKVATFTRHPNYASSILDNDFAVLGFEAGVTITFGANVAPVTLTESTDPSDGSMVTVSGWGVTSESASSSPINLKEVSIPVVSQDVCRRTYSFLTVRQICLGGTPQGGQSACFGDSGGPCVQNGVQYALVSGGNSCEAPNVPGIYARISTARAWIRQQTGV